MKAKTRGSTAHASNALNITADPSRMIKCVYFFLRLFFRVRLRSDENNRFLWQELLQRLHLHCLITNPQPFIIDGGENVASLSLF